MRLPKRFSLDEKSSGIGTSYGPFFLILIREKHNPACSHLVSIAGTTYGDRMTRFDILRSQRKWLTDNLAILIVGLLLTTGVWFCFDAHVFPARNAARIRSEWLLFSFKPELVRVTEPVTA